MLIDKMSGVEVRGGLAKNDSMIRVDIFRHKKNFKFHLVPVYTHHRVTELPNRAVVSKKPEAQWTEMDDQYEFQFSLYSNDLFRLIIGEEAVVGYFSGINTNDGGIKFFPHDQRNVDSLRKKGASGAKAILKLQVDLLGNTFPSPRETRRDLA